MAFSFKKFFKGINIVPKSGSTASVQGDIEVDSATSKLNFHNGTSASPMVTEAHTATLLNKALSDSTTTIVDVSDATKVIKFNAAGTTGTSTTITGSQTADRVLTLPNATDTLVAKATTDTFTNKTFDVDGTGNSLTNIADANIKSAAAIARAKVASGTADHVLINSGAGALSSEATLAVSRGGTNSGTTLNNNRIMKSSGSAIVEATAITASRALVSDANGIPVHATTTTTEIGYVNGVTSAIQTQLDAIVALTFPAGVMLPYGGSAAPTGFLLCDGSSVLRASYPNLFTAIGTTFGSADGTHFTLPNTARRVLVGAGGSGTATLANTVGSTGGEETHTLTAGESGVPAHTHTFSATSGGQSVSHTHDFSVYNDPAANGAVAGGRGSGAGISGTVTTTTGSQDHTHSVSGTSASNSTASGTAHNNIQPSLVINHIIKT